MVAQSDVIADVMTAPRLLDAGDAAFTIEYGNAIDASLIAAVQSLDAAIAREQAAGRLPGLIETMPTFRSLTVFFDPLQTGRRELIDALRPLLDAGTGATTEAGRRWRLPVCYEGQDNAPDLAETARAIGLGADTDALIALHSGTEYRVYMIGFLPGFAFMGDVPEPLRLPRRPQPRVRVPPGSVAVANALTGIYPWQSPGGWHLLGRCPVPMFDAKREAPSLLAPGDRVRYVPVPMSEFQRLESAIAGGEIEPSHWWAADNETAP